MKIRQINEYAANIISGFVTIPVNTAEIFQNDFIGKRFELDFLQELSASENGIAISDVSYTDKNRLLNLQRAGLIKIGNVNGTPTAFITDKGRQWYEAYDQARSSIIPPISGGLMNYPLKDTK